MPKNKKSGFSLMEALVSFVIIAVFLAIVVPMITGISDANGITGYFSNYEEVGYPITKKVDGFEGNTIYVKAGEKDENPIEIDGVLYKNDGYGEPKVKKRKIFIRVSDLPVFKEPTGETKACLAVFNVKDFDKIRDNQDGCFVLMDDINFTEYRSKETKKIESWNWSPIPSFSGRLYGNGKILYNLHDSLFNNLKSGALIQDFGIHDSTFISGALANNVDGGAQVEIRNIYLRDVKIKKPNTNVITGEVAIGGLIDKVGENASVKITLFQNNAEFDIGKDENTEGHYLGGIIGKTESRRLEISRSSNYADIKPDGKYTIGGLVGLNTTGTAEIKYSLNEGCLNGHIVGGFIGSAIGEDVTIKESYSKGFLNSGHVAGGFVGNTKNSLTIQDSYAVNTFSGGNDVGGMVGMAYDNVRGSYTVKMDNTYVIPKFENIAADARAGLFIGSVTNLNVEVNNGNYSYPAKGSANIKPEFWGYNNDPLATTMPETTEMSLVAWKDNKKWFAAAGEGAKQADLFTTFDNKTWLLEKKFRPILKRTPEALTGQDYSDLTSNNALPDFLANKLTEEEFIEAAISQYENEELTDDEKVINTFFNLDQLCEAGSIDCERTIAKDEWTITNALNTKSNNYGEKCEALKDKVKEILEENKDTDRKRLRRYLQHINCYYYSWVPKCPTKTCETCSNRTKECGGYSCWGINRTASGGNIEYTICPNCSETYNVRTRVQDSKEVIIPKYLKARLLDTFKITAEFRTPIRKVSELEISENGDTIENNTVGKLIKISSMADLNTLSSYDDKEIRADRAYRLDETRGGNKTKRRYILTNDIIIDDANFGELCTHYTVNGNYVGFNGNFNGNGHAIIGLSKALFWGAKAYKNTAAVQIYNLQIRDSKATKPAVILNTDRAEDTNLSLKNTSTTNKCTTHIGTNNCTNAFQTGIAANRGTGMGNEYSHSIDMDATDICKDIIEND